MAVAPTAIEVGITGVLWFTAIEETEDSTTRFNLFRLDLAEFELARVTRGELIWGVVADDREVFACPYTEPPALLDVGVDSDASRGKYAPSLRRFLPPAESFGGRLVLADDRLVWMERNQDTSGGSRLMSYSREAGSIATVFESDRHLGGPVVDGDGSLLALERPDDGTASRCRLLTITASGDVVRHKIKGLDRAWYLRGVVGVGGGLVVLSGEVGADRDNTTPAVVLVDPANGETVTTLPGQPLTTSPDRSLLLLQQYGATVTLTVAPLPELTWTTTFAEIGLMRITDACWSTSAVAAPHSEHPRVAVRAVRGDRQAVHPGPPRPAPPLEDVGVAVEVPEGIWLSVDSRLCLEHTCADLTVQIRNADDDTAARHALAAASTDLYWLGTDPDEGSIDIPNHVSDVKRDPRGYFVQIDTNDTPPELLRRIPGIVRQHLLHRGVVSAEIALVESGRDSSS